MSAGLLIFYALALLAVGSALAMAMLVHRLVAGALCLLVTLLALAGIYVLLEAHFVAVAQIIIYAAVVMLVLLFVLMLGDSAGEFFGAPRSRQANRGVIAATAVVMLFGLVATQLPSFAPASPVAAGFGGSRQLGLLLQRDFAIPFALLGLLLLAAIVGAAFVARRGVAE